MRERVFPPAPSLTPTKTPTQTPTETPTQTPSNTATATQTQQLPLFNSAVNHPVLEALTGVNPDELTPRQALELLFHLKQLSGA